MNRAFRSGIIAATALAFLLLAGCASTAPQTTPTAEPTASDREPVQVTYLGHSAVEIVAPDGTRVICDPYTAHPAGLKEFPSDRTANAVTISHFHEDHVNLKAVQGSPRVLSRPESFSVGMVRIQGYVGDHGLERGTEGYAVGDNTIFVFAIDEVVIAHLGGAGFLTQADVLAAIAGADLVVMDGGMDPNHPFDRQIEQLRALHVGAILIGHYSPDPKHLFYGVPTLDELLARLPADLARTKMGSVLEVMPRMPEHVAVMTPLLAG